METNIEQKIISYECNLIKQAFFDKEVLIYLRDRIPDDFFSNQIRQVIWKTLCFINDQGENVSRSSVEDVFNLSDNVEHIDKVWEIIDNEYTDEDHWKYHYRYLHEIYAKNNILKLSEQVRDRIHKHAADKTIDWLVDNLQKYDSREESYYDISSSISRTREEILLRKEGKINPYIKTGSPKFDGLAKMDFGQIILIASSRKIGKTKFTVHLLMEMLAIDPSIIIKYYSFELSEKEMMYEIISREVNLTAEQIQSKDYTLSKQEIELIDDAFNRIQEYDFNISTTPVSINQIEKDYINFCKKKKTNRCILVIDNIGLLKEKGRSQTEIDDHIARTLVDIRDKTKSLIIPIHHMTKDVDAEDRLKEGYRPLLRHLKGSTRIQDYANKVFLLHRPGFYDDLVAKETAKGMIELSNGKFQRGKVIDRIFIVDVALNRGNKKGVVRFLHKLQYCQFKEWK